ncbi:MAG: MBL fold metallo-hydrolase [Crocinitomicaceae bacterium]|nr:MBL fold metallo-hydrolase [Crocinitomicaceae bacterium]
MTFTFLGTGTSQGIPVIACDCEVCSSIDKKDNRTRTSLLINADGKNLVIDTGPDFRQQMLRENVKTLEAVIFTHEHKDHIAGMDDIRAFNFIAQKPMRIYATEKVFAALQREYHYVYSGSDYPGIPQVETIIFENEPITFFNQKIIPVNVMHHKMPVKAFRIQDFTYITDANFIIDESMRQIAGTRILVINALRKEKHISHFNLEEALEIIQKIKPEKAYLTHISHLLGKHEDISKELPAGVELAYDGLKIEL